MVFKLHEQDLFGLTDAYGQGMPERFTCQILRSMAEALDYIHSKGVYHR